MQNTQKRDSITTRTMTHKSESKAADRYDLAPFSPTKEVTKGEQNDHTKAPDNHSYQQQLAHSLVKCLGQDGAVHACQANAWDGVLDFILTPNQQKRC